VNGRMPLRRTAGRRCVRIGLAAVALAIAASPPAFGATEKPKPSALWNAFPLNPSSPPDAASERPASPLLPPTQGRSEATTVIDAPPEASRPGVVMLGFAILLALLATIVVLSGRRLYVHRHHRASSLPLWQGVAWPHSSDGLREVHESGVRTSPALVRGERRTAEPYPDVPAPRYRWADQAPVRRSRRSATSAISRMIARMERVVRTEESAAAVIGAAVAGVAALVFFYLVG
jgi:hypothetical protein